MLQSVQMELVNGFSLKVHVCMLSPHDHQHKVFVYPSIHVAACYMSLMGSLFGAGSGE